MNLNETSYINKLVNEDKLYFNPLDQSKKGKVLLLSTINNDQTKRMFKDYESFFKKVNCSITICFTTNKEDINKLLIDITQNKSDFIFFVLVSYRISGNFHFNKKDIVHLYNYFLNEGIMKDIPKVLLINAPNGCYSRKHNNFTRICPIPNNVYIIDSIVSNSKYIKNFLEIFIEVYKFNYVNFTCDEVIKETVKLLKGQNTKNYKKYNICYLLTNYKMLFLPIRHIRA
uniref:Caspase family p20 domain-containing protein n=1 Tax=viral metagenome TaxID=1070528 RepID=A0A6C0JV65_9ZZZZ